MSVIFAGDKNDPRYETDMAFETALLTGRLSETMGQPNYVGDYMYMGTHPKTRRAAFKHRDTREYLK